MSNLDINREIGRIRAIQGHNWSAIALQRIQDYINGLVISTPTPTPTPIPSGGGSSTPTTPTTFQLKVNGVPVAHDAANLNNALPTAPPGMESLTILLDNTMPTPNISVNAPIRASEAFVMLLMGG